MSPVEELEGILRPLVPEVLGAVVRRHGRFDACEDAVQEALLAATTQWPRDGVPGSPRAWLIAVASRRLVDELRAEAARVRREVLSAEPEAAPTDSAPEAPARTHDDTLTLLFLCCHQSLTPASQVALTLRAVGGLSTAEIARAFFVPEATMAQRISRAKATLAGASFELPPAVAQAGRLSAVLHVLYLIFNEGYSASSGEHIQRESLAEEAIRLTRMLTRLLPREDEARGLLALMLLTHARSGARTGADGSLISLAEQDRTRWDGAAIEEGLEILSVVLTSGPVGPFQLQAAIAAVHAEAASAELTDWREITALYELLERTAPNPVFTLGRAVALAMVRGPAAGLELLDALERDGRLGTNHRLPAVRGHLLELTGGHAEASEAYEAAAALTTSLPERRYLERRAAAARRAGVDRRAGATR